MRCFSVSLLQVGNAERVLSSDPIYFAITRENESIAVTTELLPTTDMHHRVRSVDIHMTDVISAS